MPRSVRSAFAFGLIWLLPWALSGQTSVAPLPQQAAAPRTAPTRDIRLLPTSGGQTRRLGEPGADDRAPAWSPDGRQIAFQRLVGPDSVGFDKLVLAIANADGSGLRLYPDAPPPLDPRPLPAPMSWSPDGRWIAYRTRLTAEMRDRVPAGALQTGSNAIVVLSLESGESRVLASADNLVPIFWTDDSRAVVYVCGAACRPSGVGQGANAWESPITGEPRRDLGPVPGGNSVSLANGDWIGTSRGGLRRLRASGASEVLLEGIAPPAFAVTRDGQHYAAFVAAEDGSATGVLRMGREGGATVDVPLGAAPLAPMAWSPDGSRLYVRVRDGVRYAILAVAADGSTVERVTPVDERIVADFVLSPDGSTLAYASGADLFSYRALIYPLDAGEPAVTGEELWALHQEVEELHADLPLDFAGWDLQWLDPGPTRRAWLLAEAMAERGVRLGEAEATVREGLDLRERRMEEQAGDFSNVELYAQTLDELRSSSYAAIGWIRFHAGDLDAARRELTRAFETRNDDPGILYKLGRVLEAAGEVERAEGWYAFGSAVEQRGDDYRENLGALRRLYRARAGSLEGFEGYLAAIEAREKLRLREMILGSRIAEPRAMPAFELPWLVRDGVFDSGALEGKVVVINFWGVWCGPCVREAPYIQEFARRFADHPDVVFLTIANDSDPNVTRSFLEREGFDFPVLLALDENGQPRGVARAAGVQGYPTTLFLDRQGRITFWTLGASLHLVDEFSWRVEALLGTGSNGSPGGRF